MVNMIIRVLIFATILISSFTPVANADSGGLKQCFYIITKHQTSAAIAEDLNILNARQIPVFVIINPHESTNKNVIDVLKKCQQKTKLNIILEDVAALEKSYFAVRGYDNILKISGVCKLQKDELNYIGKTNTLFKVVATTADPITTLATTNKLRQEQGNYALVVTGGELNIATLLLAYNELPGTPLAVANYALHLKKTALIYDVFAQVGNVTIAFFAVCALILLVAIAIFKRWSKEKFFD